MPGPPPTSALRRSGAAWGDYWFAPVDARPIAAFRILYGLYLCWYLGRWMGTVELAFSDQGVSLALLVPEYAPPPWGAWLVFLATLGAALCFTLGIACRWATPALLAGYLHHYLLHFAATSYSYDRLNLIILGILCLAEVDRAWAWGAVPGRRATTTGWATKLLRWELVLMYTGSGIWKLTNPLWRDGELIRMTFAGDWGTPTSFWLLGLGLPARVFDAATWGVIAFELAVGWALFVRRLRAAAITAGVAFHVANWVLLGIPEFLSCVTLYVLFVPGEALQRWVDRVRTALPRWLGFPPPSPGAGR